MASAQVPGGGTPALLPKERSRRSPSTRKGTNTAQPQNVPEEKACMLCHRTQADTDICGHKRMNFKLCVHTYCQILATGLYPNENTGRFLVGDTRRIIREAAKKSCVICYKMGASITCCHTGCDRTFHLPCAPDGGCVTQYFGAYRSFCWEHRPQQALQPRPSQDSTCSICLDTVEDKISYTTMGCPVCQDARFHRHCIQRMALHAGIAFRCPRCLNQEPFMINMLIVGIRLSKSPPSWYSDPDIRPSRQRHGRCDAATCLCPGGREHAEADGPWQLCLCASCAAMGTYQRCSSLANSTHSSKSTASAGPDSASTDNPDFASPSTSTQALSGLAEGTLAANTQPARPKRPYRPPWIFHGSTKDNRSQPGPIRMRHVWRQQRRAKTPYSRPTNNNSRAN
ncbi:PHD finger protein 7-like isoform X2 [Cyanistes caeruleus]|uniref:PHD finger protein 7-like isoform X2 n=1 Tax=Cyanistes caeruleus TaxID=156563 RepID=UPI000CDB167F|nr:PHD finger protein 7-like isoform X2 [Cyanistes caeruleus]